MNTRILLLSGLRVVTLLEGARLGMKSGSWLLTTSVGARKTWVRNKLVVVRNAVTFRAVQSDLLYDRCCKTEMMAA